MNKEAEEIKRLFEERGWDVFINKDIFVVIKRRTISSRILVILIKEKYNDSDIIRLREITNILDGKMSLVRRQNNNFLIDVIDDKYTFNLSKKKRTSNEEISKKINNLKNKINSWN